MTVVLFDCQCVEWLFEFGPLMKAKEPNCGTWFNLGEAHLMTQSSAIWYTWKQPKFERDYG
jgi:hypothetical protein